MPGFYHGFLGFIDRSVHEVVSMLKINVIFLMMLLLVSMVYAYPITIESQFTYINGSARVGTYTANFTFIDSTDAVVFSDISSITTTATGKFKKEFDFPYFGNETLRVRAIVNDSDTGLVNVAYVPYAINAQYLQGKSLDYFAYNGTLVNNTINSKVTQSYIETLGFNTTIDLFNYFNDLYQAIGNYLVSGSHGQVTIDGANITTGTISDSRIPGSITRDSEVPGLETDSAHDTCTEISGCIVGAITDGNTGWDNSYGFYNALVNFTQNNIDGKLCIYNLSTDRIQCNYNDNTGFSSDQAVNITSNVTHNNITVSNNLYVSNNITVLNYTCFNAGCTSYAYHNGTALIQRG